MRDNIAYTDISKSATANCVKQRQTLGSLQIQAIDSKLARAQNIERIQQWEGIINEMPHSESIARFIQFFGNPTPANTAALASKTTEMIGAPLSNISPPANTHSTTIANTLTPTDTTASIEMPSADLVPSVTVQGSSERFLSPIAQLVALKSANKELELSSEQRERARLESEIYAKVYCQLAQDTKASSSGKQAIATFDALQAQALKNADINSPAVERAKLNLEQQSATWHNRYFEELRFLSEPVIAKEQKRKLGTMVAAALGGFLGLFLGAIALWVREWWSNHFSAADFS